MVGDIASSSNMSNLQNFFRQKFSSNQFTLILDVYMSWPIAGGRYLPKASWTDDIQTVFLRRWQWIYLDATQDKTQTSLANGWLPGQQLEWQRVLPHMNSMSQMPDVEKSTSKRHVEKLSHTVATFNLNSIILKVCITPPFVGRSSSSWGTQKPMQSLPFPSSFRSAFVCQVKYHKISKFIAGWEDTWSLLFQLGGTRGDSTQPFKAQSLDQILWHV